MQQELERAEKEEGERKKRELASYQPLDIKNSIVSKLPNWRVEEILNHYVNGEAYFIGGQRKWKEIVLNYFGLLYHNKISIRQLLEIIKEQGIEFQQPEKFMAIPIEEFIKFISKKVKREIKV